MREAQQSLLFGTVCGDLTSGNADGVPGETCQLRAWTRARSKHRVEPGRLCHLRNEVNIRTSEPYD